MSVNTSLGRLSFDTLIDDPLIPLRASAPINLPIKDRKNKTDNTTVTTLQVTLSLETLHTSICCQV